MVHSQSQLRGIKWSMVVETKGFDPITKSQEQFICVYIYIYIYKLIFLFVLVMQKIFSDDEMRFYFIFIIFLMLCEINENSIFKGR